MHRFKRLLTAIFLTILSVILIFSAALAYLIITPVGGKLLVKYFKQQLSQYGLIHIGHYDGSLHRGFVLKDIRVKGLAYLPDSVLLIQEMHVRLPLWDLPHSDFGIFNARLLMPDSDPVVFTGDLYAGQIKGNLYSGSVDLQTASRFWLGADLRKGLQGFISNADFVIQGPMFSPRVQGSFVVDSVRYKSVQLTGGASRADFVLLPAIDQWQIKGDVMVDSGTVKVRDKDLQLSRTKLMFQGNVFAPLLDIHLGAKVEDMDFHLAISGTVSDPQLEVSSDPPMPPQEALRVLFTGNAFSSSTSPFNGITSTDLAENFLNYSLQDINQDQFGMKTKLTENLKLGMEMDQMPGPPGETNVYYSRRINGEMDLNNNMSLNVSREVLTQDSYAPTSYQDADPTPDTEIYLQYKKRF